MSSARWSDWVWLALSRLDDWTGPDSSRLDQQGGRAVCVCERGRELERASLRCALRAALCGLLFIKSAGQAASARQRAGQGRARLRDRFACSLSLCAGSAGSAGSGPDALCLALPLPCLAQSSRSRVPPHRPCSRRSLIQTQEQRATHDDERDEQGRFFIRCMLIAASNRNALTMCKCFMPGHFPSRGTQTEGHLCASRAFSYSIRQRHFSQLAVDTRDTATHFFPLVSCAQTSTQCFFLNSRIKRGSHSSEETPRSLQHRISAFDLAPSEAVGTPDGLKKSCSPRAVATNLYLACIQNHKSYRAALLPTCDSPPLANEHPLAADDSLADVGLTARSHAPPTGSKRPV